MISATTNAANHYRCVVEHGGSVCGCRHGDVLILLESESSVEIGSLVVDGNMHGPGIGRAPLEAYEH